MFSPNSCLARAVSDALHGSTGCVGCQLCWGSIPIPPHPLLACSPKKSHSNPNCPSPPTPAAKINYPPLSPARGLLFLGRELEWGEGEWGKVGQEVGLLLIVVILAIEEVWQEREPGAKVVLSRAGACMSV